MPIMKHSRGIADSQFYISAILSKIFNTTRGPARYIAKMVMEQVLQFMRLGMPTEIALCETLQAAIHLAEMRVKHCVGSERHPFDDLIQLCSEIISRTNGISRIE